MQTLAITKTTWAALSAQATSGLRTLGVVWLSASVVLALLLAAAAGAGIPMLELTRDPTASIGVPFYTGAISQLGVLLWSAAAATALFCVALLRRASVERDAQRFFLASGLLTSLLLFDDLFLLHESVFPFHLGIPEELVLGIYASLTLAYLYHHRAFIARTNYVILLLAAAWFAGSVGIDLVREQGTGLMVAEDVAKILGIATWCTYFVHCGLDLMGSRLQREAAAP